MHRRRHLLSLLLACTLAMTACDDDSPPQGEADAADATAADTLDDAVEVSSVDADDDGWSDDDEQACGTDPEDASSTPEDSDSDGSCDAIDDDDDDDGVVDEEDAFPLDPTETTDTDGDGTGDDADTDDDDDGVVDEEDAFPLDPTETTDTDGDGTGDNADTDDDGDGMPDTWEEDNSLDPLDPSDAQADPDEDGRVNIDEYEAGGDPNVDELAPTTTLTGPTTEASTVFTITFSSDDPEATHECRLSGGDWFACASGDELSVDAAGEYTLEVRGTDTAGNVEDPPASITWTAEPAWVVVTAGEETICAIANDDTAWCWGSNVNHQLGDGSRAASATPVQIPGLWRSIEPAANHTCGVKTDGTLWCWGETGRVGVLGLGAQTGRVTSPGQVGTDTDWVRVETGVDVSCALKEDDSAWCWGDNSSGRTGIGETAGVATTPISLGSLRWRDLALGDIFGCGVTLDSELYCWGQNGSGATTLGDFNAITATPTRVGSDSDWSRVFINNSLGFRRTFALKNDNTLWRTGAAIRLIGSAELPPNPNALTAVDTTESFVSVVMAQQSFCAIHTDGSRWCWGNDILNWGDGDLDVRSAAQPTRVGTDSNWVHIVGHKDALCGLRRDGGLDCWGFKGYGLGNGESANFTTPEPIGTDTDWADVSVAVGRNIALKEDGQRWYSGFINTAELGVDDDSRAPLFLLTHTAYGETGWDEVVSMGSFACGLRAGDVYCWGVTNIFTGDGEWILTPRQLTSSGDYVEIDIASTNVFARRADGTLWVFGLNFGGLAGLGHRDPVRSLTQVGAATDWASISGSSRKVCGIRDDQGARTLWCWGHGSLGTGEYVSVRDPVLSPTQIGSDTDWEGVDAGAFNTLLTKADGSLWNIGIDLNQGFDNVLVPTRLGTDSDWASPHVGDEGVTWLACAIKQDGALFCAGRNQRGGLGDGTYEARFPMVPVAPGAAWSMIDIGLRYTCGVQTDGTLWCWGLDERGILGTGEAYQPNPSPVLVP